MRAPNNSIRKIRQRKKISIEAFAQKMGTNTTVIQAWENDCTRMNLKQLIQMAKILDVSLDAMIFGDEVNPIDISSMDEDGLEFVMKIVLERIHIKPNSRKGLERNVVLDDYIDFGDRLKYVRVKIMGIFQEELGDIIGVTKETIKSWEGKRDCTSVSCLISVAHATGISMDFFAIDNSPMLISASRLTKENYAAVNEFVKYYINHEKNRTI